MLLMPAPGIFRWSWWMRVARNIQVIDDGKGMSDTDARLAFERHSTSKIRKADRSLCPPYDGIPWRGFGFYRCRGTG